MLTKLTKHLKTRDELDKFTLTYQNSKEVLEVIDELLTSDYEASIKRMQDSTHFILPSWSKKQAYELGLQQGLNKAKKLLEQ